MHNRRTRPLASRRHRVRVVLAIAAVALPTMLVAVSCSDGDSPSTSTTAEPGADDVDSEALTLYGIDFSALTDLPEAEPYDDYELVEDDTQQLEVTVPTAWDDVDTRTAERDGEVVPGVWASTDLEALDSGYTVPGLHVDLRTANSDRDLLDLLDSDNATADSCESSESFDYDDGLFTGTAELWTGCGGTSAALLHVAAHRGEEQYVSVQIQMLTDADVEAALRALADFNAIELGTDTDPADDETDPETTTDPEGEPSAPPENSGGFQIETDDGNVVDIEADMPIFPVRGGDLAMPGAGEFMIEAPVGPDDQWRLTEEPNILHAMATYDGTSLDGEKRYFKFLSLTYGYTTVTFENCPGCPEDGGEPTEVIEIGITVEPGD